MTDDQIRLHRIARELIEACEKAMDLRIPPAERELLKMIIAHWHDPQRMELTSQLNRAPRIVDSE